MQKKKEGKGEEKKDNNKGKEKVEEVNAVTYKDDGEVLFTSSLPTNVLVEADQNVVVKSGFLILAPHFM